MGENIYKMNDLNRAEFIGRVGQDPKIRYLQDGTATANFSIAVGKSWKNRDGHKQESTTWVSCVAWRKLAEIIGEYVKKGQQIYVTGEYTVRTWEKEGVKQYTTEIVVNAMQMLGGRPETQAQPKPEQQAKSDYQHVETQTGGTDIDDFIPF